MIALFIDGPLKGQTSSYEGRRIQYEVPAMKPVVAKELLGEGNEAVDGVSMDRVVYRPVGRAPNGIQSFSVKRVARAVGMRATVRFLNDQFPRMTRQDQVRAAGKLIYPLGFIEAEVGFESSKLLIVGFKLYLSE